MQNSNKTSILSHRQFFRLWVGQVTSQAGAKVYQIAIIWWIMTHTASEQSGLMLGAFMVAQALPSLLFFKLMGAVVDKMPSKFMLVVCDLSSASIMALIAWQLSDNTLTLALLMLFGFLSTFIEGFFNPAISKCLPEMVDGEYLEDAIAYQSSTQHLSSFGGSVLGAFLISWLGIPVLVAATSVTYLISAAIEMTLTFPNCAPSPENSENLEDAGSAAKDWTQIPLLKKLLYSFGLVNFFATPVFIVLPLYVKNIINGTSKSLGLLESCLWIGILIGTFAASKIDSNGRALKLAALSVFIFGICLFIPGILPIVYTYGAALAIAGFSLGVNNVKITTLFQTAVPGYMKGHFFAAMQAILSFSFPIAYLVFGWLGDAVGPMKVCIIQGFGMLLTAALFMKMSPQENLLMEYQNGLKNNDNQ